MEGILKFKLPEENEEFKMASNAGHAYIVIEDMDNFLRGKLKYCELTEEEERIYQEVRDKLWELKNDDL